MLRGKLSDLTKCDISMLLRFSGALHRSSCNDLKISEGEIGE